MDDRNFVSYPLIHSSLGFVQAQDIEKKKAEPKTPHCFVSIRIWPVMFGVSSRAITASVNAFEHDGRYVPASGSGADGCVLRRHPWVLGVVACSS